MLFIANTLNINYLGLTFGCIVALAGIITAVSAFIMPSSKSKRRSSASLRRTRISYKKPSGKKYKTKIKYK
ncbi:MAG: hypothetical protein K6F76_08275 [Clostridiales bacterium]|nr:hypothetical protein [Clostridiales bacterium]